MLLRDWAPGRSRGTSEQGGHLYQLALGTPPMGTPVPPHQTGVFLRGMGVPGSLRREVTAYEVGSTGPGVKEEREVESSSTKLLMPPGPRMQVPEGLDGQDCDSRPRPPR